jgi:hypothetical protein
MDIAGADAGMRMQNPYPPIHLPGYPKIWYVGPS